MGRQEVCGRQGAGASRAPRDFTERTAHRAYKHCGQARERSGNVILRKRNNCITSVTTAPSRPMSPAKDQGRHLQRIAVDWCDCGLPWSFHSKECYRHTQYNGRAKNLKTQKEEEWLVILCGVVREGLRTWHFCQGKKAKDCRGNSGICKPLNSLSSTHTHSHANARQNWL